MTKQLLCVDRVSKAYTGSYQIASRAKAFVDILLNRPFKRSVPVLEDISFAVNQGESLGIIGSNGAGKSTLLKVISNVVRPSLGSVQRTGSMAALLELGAGFELEFNGIDNVRMNGAFLGLSAKEIEERMEDILSFADIGDAVYEPVKHYSSGMVVRLGFAIVASVRPDLLVTDEVLAVGDESFQKKCIRWIESYLNDGGTLLMVSHNMYQVQKLCSAALWLDDGKVRAYGNVFDVTQAYLAWHETKDSSHREEAAFIESGGLYSVRHIEVLSHDATAPLVAMGDTLSIRVEVYSPDGRAPNVLIGIVRADGSLVYGVATDHDEVRLSRTAENVYKFQVDFSEIPLLPGGYAFTAHAMDPEGLRLFDTAEVKFSVSGNSRELGSVRLPHRWLV